MLEILSAGDYRWTAGEGQPLPGLDAMLAPLVKDRSRRADRFIQLALLGAARCAEGARPLAADCGLYLASGVGQVGNNVAVQEQLGLRRQPPKPFDFVNTLGSAAGYYVAKGLGLGGQNLFVSRWEGSFQAALKLAVVDLALGVVSQALVGAVEECTLPLDQHRRRQGLAAGTSVAEGSHWVLLGTESGKGMPVDLRRFENRPAADAFLSSTKVPGDRLELAIRVSKETPGEGFHNSLDAARIVDFVKGRPGGRLRFLSGDDDAGWFLLDLGA